MKYDIASQRVLKSESMISTITDSPGGVLPIISIICMIVGTETSHGRVGPVDLTSLHSLYGSGLNKHPVAFLVLASDCSSFNYYQT